MSQKANECDWICGLLAVGISVYMGMAMLRGLLGL